MTNTGGSGEVSRWRAAYTPGDWVVLSGPTSLVVLEPSSIGHSSLIATLWAEVVAASSLVEVAERLATYRIDDMASFAAFFWSEDGMRSLVRGDVSVMDLANGKIVADGVGVQTWREVGLENIQQVRVEPAGVGDATLLELPLVVGVVTASSITLDASDEARVISPQVAPVWDDSAQQQEPQQQEPQHQEPQHQDLQQDSGHEDLGNAAAAAAGLAPVGLAPVGPIGDLDSDNADTEVMSAEHDEAARVGYDDYQDRPDESGHQEYGFEESYQETPHWSEGGSDFEEPTLPVDDGQSQLSAAEANGLYGDEPRGRRVAPESELMAGESLIMATLCPRQHSNPPQTASCRVCGAPVPHQNPRLVTRPALATLRGPDGAEAELDLAVIIGRAPNADRSTVDSPRLLTVLSPGHDISRTHAQVEADGWEIVVTDLHSTNGTAVVLGGPEIVRRRLAPGESMVVPLGSILELGDGVSVAIDSPR